MPNGDDAGVVEPNALGLPELLPNPEKADFGASAGCEPLEGAEPAPNTLLFDEAAGADEPPNTLLPNGEDAAVALGADVAEGLAVPNPPNVDFASDFAGSLLLPNPKENLGVSLGVAAGVADAAFGALNPNAAGLGAAGFEASLEVDGAAVEVAALGPKLKVFVFGAVEFEFVGIEGLLPF